MISCEQPGKSLKNNVLNVITRLADQEHYVVCEVNGTPLAHAAVCSDSQTASVKSTRAASASTETCSRSWADGHFALLALIFSVSSVARF